MQRNPRKMSRLIKPMIPARMPIDTIPSIIERIVHTMLKPIITTLRNIDWKEWN